MPSPGTVGASTFPSTIRSESPQTSVCNGPAAGGNSRITVFGVANAAWMFCITAPPDPQAWLATCLCRRPNNRPTSTKSVMLNQAASGCATSKASTSANRSNSSKVVSDSPPATRTLVAARSSAYDLGSEYGSGSSKKRRSNGSSALSRAIAVGNDHWSGP